MTSGAQQALRRTMELYSKTTRFALACNQSDKIIGKINFVMFAFCRVKTIIIYLFIIFFLEAIQSRCAVLRYTKLTDSQVLERILDICEKEKVLIIHSFLSITFIVLKG